MRPLPLLSLGALALSLAAPWFFTPAWPAGPPAGGPDHAALVRQLGSDVHAEREAAQCELARLGVAAKGALAGGLKSDDVEVRRRAAVLLADVRRGEASQRKAQIERDLQLRVTLERPGYVLWANEELHAAVTLVNTSKTATHVVVKSNDGSEVGWREPHVYWEATIDRGDGKPVPVWPKRQDRCGLFPFDWPKDAAALKPGGQMALEWERLPPDFQQPGRVKLRARYSYAAGRSGAGRVERWPDERLGLMAGVPAFELVSAPVEFDVVRPLEVRVRVKRPLKVGEEARLSDLIDLTLVNVATAAVECHRSDLNTSGPGDVVVSSEAGYQPKLSQQQGRRRGPLSLAPGKSVALIGAGDFANGVDGTWLHQREGLLGVRFGYTVKPGVVVWSDWVDVRVEE